MTFSKTLKTLILAIFMAVALLFAQSPIMLLGASIANNVDSNLKLAAGLPSSAVSDVSSKVSNNNFSSTGSTISNYVYTPTSWTAGTNEKLDSIKYGVVDLNDLEKRYENFGFTTENKPALPHASENKVLLINSTSNETGAKLNYYQDVSLDANSYYKISVNAYTSSQIVDGSVKEGWATVYLDNDDFTAEQSTININTDASWKTFTFFVATSPYKNPTVKLNLYLGNKNLTSTGYVLFDNIKVYQYSENKFNELTSSLPEYTKLIDQRVSAITNPADSGYVDINIDNWKREASNGTTYMEKVSNGFLGSNGNLNDVYTGTNLSSTTTLNGIAFSAEDGYINYTSPDIKIERNKLYKISFYAKGNITSGSMNAVLSGEIFNTPDDEDNNKQSASFTSINTSTNKFTNDWIEYAFYVSGNSLYDTTINLTLGLGSESANASGYIVYAYINSYALTYTQFNNAKNLGTSTTLAMSTSPTLSFSNSAFNIITQNDDTTKPDTPSNWTHQLGDQNATVAYGVVNTSSSIFTQYTSLGSEVVNPYTKNGDYTNNALVLRNVSKTYQSYYCADQYTINADTYYLVSLDINLQKDLLGTGTSGAYVYLKDSNNNTLASFRYAGNNTNEWQTLKIYLHSAFESRNITPYLYLGNEQNPTTGVVFFDNCKIAESTADDFNAAVNGATTKVVDLENDLTSLYTEVNNNIYTPSLFKVTNGDDSIAGSKLGIINPKSLPSFITKNPGTDNTTMLMISCQEEAYYTYTSTLDYTFNANTYYKVSVDVKTAQIKHTLNPDTENENTIFGASVALNGVTGAIIEDINTQPTSFVTLEQALKDENNEFKTYEFFVYPTETSTMTLQFSLGSEEKLCSGYAFFKNIVIKQIDEDTYNTEIALLTNNGKTSLPNSVLNLVDVETTEEPESQSYSQNSDWWASTFTIIIALAVIVALVGFGIKRFNASRKETVSVSNNYDRLQTLLKDVDRRNKVADINLKIRNLQEELKQSQKFLEEEKENYNKESSSYETAKEIADDTGIAIDSPQKKLETMQNNIAELEQKIDSISLDIEVLEEEKARIKKQEQQDIEKSKKQKIIKNRK